MYKPGSIVTLTQDVTIGKHTIVESTLYKGEQFKVISERQGGSGCDAGCWCICQSLTTGRDYQFHETVIK